MRGKAYFLDFFFNCLLTPVFCAFWLRMLQQTVTEPSEKDSGVTNIKTAFKSEKQVGAIGKASRLEIFSSLVVVIVGIILVVGVFYIAKQNAGYFKGKDSL